ncbi:hypothetical protein IF188_10625 [Microbacterium sp. NEAU-LLC]|uniref:WD40-like Beta Propeller Repeat n=1 Tax=Microbacterium helvum TaxID=2773713 RepID=A0ABR8NND0_9MICO|nr:hypothetical protein [Microbacterium helvum]MBD3942151.1 hypothetical protein [Microbacterium helvum]
MTAHARLPLEVAAVVAIGAFVVSMVPSLTAPAPARAAVDPAPTPTAYTVSAPADAASSDPQISADGQHVAFVSTAALVPEDTNGLADVYVATAIAGSDDPFSGAPALVSTPGPALVSDGASAHPAISADGRYVVFDSVAKNLVPGAPSSGTRQVYVHDTVLQSTTMIAAGGVEPNGATSLPDISANGRWIVVASVAGNLAPIDTDGLSDIFVVDRDADTDGSYTTMTVTQQTPLADAADYTRPRISGNGQYLLYSEARTGDSQRPGSDMYRAQVGDVLSGFNGTVFDRFSRDADLDFTGTTVADISLSSVCGAGESLVVYQFVDPQWLAVTVGSRNIDRSSGSISDVAISADGTVVAWSSNQPGIDAGGVPVPVPGSVIRTEHPSFEDAWALSAQNVLCAPEHAQQPVTLAEGTAVSLSVSGRTVAYSDRPEDAATNAVRAIDTRSGNGLAVTTTQGVMLAPVYMTQISTVSIPTAAIHDYGAAFAGAPIYRLPIYRLPIYRLPIYRLPIYRLPIYRLPIYRLPIYRLDLPGGWTQALVDTPFEGQSDVSLTLAQVLEWAAATLDSETATDAEKAAARLIRSLTLDDMDLAGSGIDALSLGALILGAAPLPQVPIGGIGSTTERWQSVVDDQGVDATVDDATVLADLDYAGVEVSRTGVDAVPLNALPIAQTMLDAFPIASTPGSVGLLVQRTAIGELDVSQLSDPSRIFATPVTGTIAANLAAVKPGATAADLAAVAPASITFGDLLATLLDNASYPWEQIAPTALNPQAASAISNYYCTGFSRCVRDAWYSFSFDPGPGESTVFRQSTAEVVLPAGSVPLETDMAAAGPLVGLGSTPTEPTSSSKETARFAFGDVAAGTVMTYFVQYQISALPGDGVSTGTLTSGELTAQLQRPYSRPASEYRETAEHMSQPLLENSIYYGWLSPSYTDVDGVSVPGPSTQVDLWLANPAPVGKRLIVSTNATDGQLSISLYRPESDTTGLGVASVGAAPGTASGEGSAGTAGAPAQAGADAGTAVAGSVLLDQSTVTGSGAATVEAAGIETTPGQPLTIRVTSSDGQPSRALYSLRVQYVDEPGGPMCAPWQAPQTADPGVVGTSDDITAETDTVYVTDTQRFGDLWTAQGANDVRAALGSLDGTGATPVHGAVLSVDASPEVRAARTQLDQDPCDMSARAALVKAINTYLNAQIGDDRSHITSIVLIGGDDVIPFAPVAEHTDQFTEQSHADDLRRPTAPDGSPCPAPAAGAVDVCATPLQAAAATGHLLTDDPYGLAMAYDTLGGTLYVPSVGLGRLVETPAQIEDAVARFASSSGVLRADSTVTAGYGAWSELPQDVTDALQWRTGSPTAPLAAPWTKADVLADVFPGDGESARVVSLNAHFSETEMLPGVDGAEDGVFTDEDLLSAASITDAQAVSGALVFTIGCHAANNLPTSYYGDSPDWVDVFQNAGAYIGNTGYGLASSTSNALGERLLTLYADWIGVTAGGRTMTAADALTQAKRAYLSGLGLYSGYDEKVLMEAVYYGLPMYTFAGSTKNMPLPELPAGLTPATTVGSLTAASLTLHPDFSVKPGPDGTTYLTADGEAPVAVSGQPVLPKTTARLAAAPEGMKARGALIRGMTSESSETIAPSIAENTVGVDAVDDATRSAVAFPSSFAHVTTQQTPTGPVDLLVVTPARVQAPVGGTGIVERFSDMSIDVEYGPASSDDDVEPLITAAHLTSADGVTTMHATADGTGSAVTALVLLVQPRGGSRWESVELTESDGVWSGAVPVDGPFRWFLQAVDAAGNVGVDTGRGHLDVGGVTAPELGDPGPEMKVPLGGRVTRSIVVTDAEPGERLTGSFVLSGEGGGTFAAGAAVVATGADGVTRAVVETNAAVTGRSSVTVTVCRTDKCDEATFAVLVPAADRPPTATVRLSSDGLASPDAVLSADASGEDPDGDPVALAYAWSRNGVPLDGRTDSTLDLAGWAVAGDVITVEVTPTANGVAGGAARDSATVVERVAVGPQISAIATAGGVDYEPGDWSAAPVTVTFECSSGAAIASCPTPVTVDADTGPEGRTVSGTMTDVLGRTATAEVVVKLDTVAPALAPTVTPNPVTLGAAATAAPNATDEGSGVASQSCGTPDSAAVGEKTVACEATDNAGNRATAVAAFTVEPPRCAGQLDRTALDPVNLDGTSVFPRPSGVTVRFAACDAAGTPVGTKNLVKAVTQVSKTALPAGAAVNEIFVPPVSGSADKFTYAKDTGAWSGTVQTSKLASGYRYVFRVDLRDGTSFTVTFGVR